MKWFVIQNNKEVNLSAIEMLGGTDKQSGGFIGKFGSGLKYAIAAALRNDIDIRICSGEKLIQFGTQNVHLDRGSVDRITMKVDNATPKPRDWTLDMGKYDWRHNPTHGLTVDWMIVRECLCNALDEGECNYGVSSKISPQAGTTKIYIRMTDEIERIYKNINQYINRGIGFDRTPIESNIYGHIYKKMGTRGRIYCAGIFVREVPEELLYDYDFNNLSLTESRTVETYNMAYALGMLINKASISFLSEFLVKSAEYPNCFENTIATSYYDIDHKKAQSAFTMAFGESAYMAPEALIPSVSDSLARCGGTKIVLADALRTALKKSDVRDYINIIGQDIVDGYEYIPSDEVTTRVDPELNNLCCAAFQECIQIFQPTKVPEFKYYKWKGSPDACPLGKCSSDGIGINCLIPKDYVLILGTMMEEFAHFVSNAPDFSRQLVSCLIDNMARYIIKNKA